MGWEDFTKLIYYSCFVLINCFDNHPDACVDSVQTYGANHEGHREGRGPGCFDFRVSGWGRGGGQAKLGVSVSAVYDGVGSGNGIGCRAQRAVFSLLTTLALRQSPSSSLSSGLLNFKMPSLNPTCLPLCIVIIMVIGVWQSLVAM